MHKKNKSSVFMVFKRHQDNLQLVKEFELPPEATHTSDITIHKNQMYLIDYHSNYIYKYDLEKLANELKFELISKVRVTKKDANFGSLEIIEVDGFSYLLVTSFANDNNLYVFDFEKFFDKHLGFEASLLFSIPSSYFTQGLCRSEDGTILYHTVNRFGTDFIFELDVAILLRRKNYRDAIIRSFLGPGPMIEDIAIIDGVLYTSDEQTNAIYAAPLCEAKPAIGYVFNDLTHAPYIEKLVSHRARVLTFEENTLDAFVEVLSTGVTFIELDVRFSSDDIGYMYHDSYFSHGKESFRFSEKTWAEIERYRYSHNNLFITKLEDVITHFAKHRRLNQRLALDLKDFGYEQYIYDICEQNGLLDAVQIFTWTPQVLFAFDEIFKKRDRQMQLFFSHVRVDSMFRVFGLPFLLSFKQFFFAFKDFVLIGQHNYKSPLGKYAKGYRHVPYFFSVPQDIIDLLIKTKGGICVTKKAYRWGDGLLRSYKKLGLKVGIFGAFFGVQRINTKAKYLYEAQKEYIDMVFMDDISTLA